MSQRVQYTGKLIRETDGARLFRSAAGKELWIPRSLLIYYKRDADGTVVFSVDGFKQRDVRAALFDEL